MRPQEIGLRLQALDRQQDLIRSADLRPFTALLPELSRLTPEALADGLLGWEVGAPDAVDLLLRAAARDPVHAERFARAVVQLLTTWPEGQGPWIGVDEVLAAAFPALVSPERDWAAERSAVAAAHRLVAGRDFTPMGRPRDEDQWPEGQALPPLDDTRGVQARLLRAGYNCGPISGEWNDATRRALVRYQAEHALPRSGRLDEATRLRLVEE